MDPFSITVGTVGLIDACLKLTRFLKQAKDGFQKIDHDLEELTKEITAIQSISSFIKSISESDVAGQQDIKIQKVINDQWLVTRNILEECQLVLGKLRALVIKVLGNDNVQHPKTKNLRKYLKQQSKEEEFNDLRQKLHAHLIGLQTSLAAVNIIFTRKSQSTVDESFIRLSEKIQCQGTELQTRITLLQENLKTSTEKTLESAVRAARSVVPLASLNQHFSTPQSVSSIFTGRASQLDTLRICLLDPSSQDDVQAQRRFVVYGLPGSGKTQFCCKFASENRQNFWGVFWIDASSSEHAKQSFSTIARIGKVEPNERAAKHWLSSLNEGQPWLLIIDNADDLDIPVESLFPDRNNSIILITTRNPTLKVHGNTSPRYYHFVEHDKTASAELLLKAADEPIPWSHVSLEAANNICKTLGYLPLALVHAGRTILSRLCTLRTYLIFFEKNWNRIRRTGSAQETRSITDANAAIYSSYELLHEALTTKHTQSSDDALELLKVFSFLHRQGIRVDTFLRAATNPVIELQERNRKDKEGSAVKNRASPKINFAQTLRTIGLQMLAFLVEQGYRPVLPQILTDALSSGAIDELRLREALKELFRVSLIYPNPDPQDDSYSMHPAVHLWVRERPEMTLADQAVWCQATATILTQAILLPPLGDNEFDEILRRDLVSHVSHVQENERRIRVAFMENRKARIRKWPTLETQRLSRAQAMQMVKFSVVYAQCGRLKEAETLQIQVMDFCMKTLGIEHTSTMDIMLLLSRTYQLTKGDEAADLQQRVLDACLRFRGEDDLKTLKVMDIVGSSRWQQGRIPEACKMHENAVNGLKNVLGENHVDTLRAMGNQGRAIGKDFRFSKAVKIHARVVPALCELLGPSHLDTLVAKDNLAMAHFDRAAYGYGHSGDLDTAVDLEQEVWEERKEKLGKENFFSLWAGLNLARIKALRGEIDDALAVFLPGHEIAIRNLGETHFGVLFGKLHYGRILTYAKRYKEAEGLLLEVIDSHDKLRKGHLDRVIAIGSLIKCRNLMGKQSETAELLEEAKEHVRYIFGEDHPWMKYLLDPVNLAEEPDDDPGTPIEPISRMDSELGSTRKLKPVELIAKYGHIFS